MTSHPVWKISKKEMLIFVICKIFILFYLSDSVISYTILFLFFIFIHLRVFLFFFIIISLGFITPPFCFDFICRYFLLPSFFLSFGLSVSHFLFFPFLASFFRFYCSSSLFLFPSYPFSLLFLLFFSVYLFFFLI